MNQFSFLPAVLAGASVALVANALPAGAISFNLSPTLTNVSGDYANISSQFGVTLSDDGLSTGQAKFTFTNVGPVSSSITDIYFGKSGTDGFGEFFSTTGVQIAESSGVDFSAIAIEKLNKPGGGIKWDAVYGADPNAPVSPNGVGNTGAESVSFTFNLSSGKTIQDAFNAFQGGDSAPLAIAFHVQSLPGGKSDWYGTSNVTPKDVPEPFTMLGTAGALGFSALFKRQQNKRSKAQAKA
ncbi:PEP-CTERM sorting domain-containing protein [Phormidium sp. CLA17]|uniref:PEP-CTERM sorting domain-containing protein n=1 Tax=Leptolyngbya sp. Cla-17 TaxID=2803751 RepID=UPI00149166BD|nr:PEP-CTERM sorting domain-containing protein [Leptolyngbya sp. Cla-17]MBM0744712.1 PEP-CTERM sorting domain-containing protein [Leptolyngbya sp. Cla-17]